MKENMSVNDRNIIDEQKIYMSMTISNLQSEKEKEHEMSIQKRLV